MKDADLILYLVDSSQKQEEIEKDIKDFNDSVNKEKAILVYSKSDLLKTEVQDSVISISLLNDDTIEKLKNEMTSFIHSKEIKLSSNDIILTNLRHRICLENVVSSLNDAVKTIDDGMSGEFISVDLRNSLKHLGEITGEVTNDEILNNIFRNFCIGK